MGALLLHGYMQAQTTLVSGDIAFVAYVSTGNPDTLAFVVLKSSGLDAGTTISFTDNGWIPPAQGGPAYRTGEGVLTWTSSNHIPFGELVKVWLGSASEIGSNKGTCTNNFGTISLSTSGDQLFAFQGGAWPNPTVMLAGLHFNRTTNSTNDYWDGSGTGASSSSSAFPTGDMGATAGKLLPLNCGLWVRDVAAGSSVKSRAAYWKGLFNSTFVGNNSESMRLSINSNANWDGYFTGSVYPGWTIPDALANQPLTATSVQTNVACYGDSSGAVTVAATGGSGTYVYNWSPCGGAGATATDLSAGTYTCTITDSFNNQVEVVVTITEAPQLLVGVDLIRPTCPNQSNGELMVSASGGTGTLQYSWLSGGVLAHAAGLPSGVFSVTVSDDNGCSVADSARVTEAVLPVVSLEPFAPMCLNTELVLTGGAPLGGSYVGSNVVEGVFKPTSFGNYSISYSVSSLDGCQITVSRDILVHRLDSATLAEFLDVCFDSPIVELTGGSPAGGYYSGLGVSGAGFNPASAGVGTHVVKYQYLNDFQCASEAAATITVRALPIPIFSGLLDSSHCMGDTVQLVVEDFASFRWYLNGLEIPYETSNVLMVSQPGEYNVEVKDSNSCSGSSASVVIKMELSPTPNISVVGSTSFCEGSCNKLVTSEQYQQFQWFRNNSILNNEQYYGLINTMGGDFKVQVIDSNNCVGWSESVTITVHSAPAVDLNSASIRELCDGDSLKLKVSFHSGSNYQWYRNELSLLNDTACEIAIQTTGLYQLKASSSEGCAAESHKILVHFNSAPEQPLVTQTAAHQLKSSAIDGNTWFRNGGLILGEYAQELQLTTTGMYSVQVRNSAGCYSQSDELLVTTLEIKEDGLLESPWKAYPNPVLDLLIIEGYESAVYSIFDNQGKLVRNGALSPGANNLDVSAIPSGIYQMRVVGELSYYLRIAKE